MQFYALSILLGNAPKTTNETLFYPWGDDRPKGKKIYEQGFGLLGAV
jgi:hypothetical protein